MRVIHVTYRAVFKRLKDTLFKYSGPINVEVIQLGNGMWISQSPETGAQFDKFTACASPESAKKEAACRFHEQVSEWSIFGKEPAPKGSKEPRPPARQLLPHEIQIKDGKVFFLETDDYTHIMDPAVPSVTDRGVQGRPDMPTGMAACGQWPKMKNFISLKANIPPTCKQCAEVYKSHATPA